MKSLLLKKSLLALHVAGQKSETRRTHGLKAVNANPDSYQLLAGDDRAKYFSQFNIKEPDQCFLFRNNNGDPDHFGTYLVVKPRLTPGEHIFIPENVWLHRSTGNLYNYVDDVPELVTNTPIFKAAYKKRSKMLSKKEWARHFSQITSVGCERLNDITEEGCLSEGIQKIGTQQYTHPLTTVVFDNPQSAFFNLFISVSDKREVALLATNPFVFYYGIKYLKGNR